MVVKGFGFVNEPQVRKKVFLFFKQLGYSFVNLVHPTSYVAKNVTLGEGCQILAGGIVQTGSVLGDNVVVNTRASIDHDCMIGNHSHIAPGVTLSGGVSIGEACHIGAGATIVQGIQIQENCLVAAGAVVISNLIKNNRVAGVPAKAM